MFLVAGQPRSGYDPEPRVASTLGKRRIKWFNRKAVASAVVSISNRRNPVGVGPYSTLVPRVEATLGSGS
jgi:hypothetical protein